MEEVWAVYLCLILFVIVYFLMKKKPVDEIMKEREATLVSGVAVSSGHVGKNLECSEEELDASLRRLSGVLLGAELLQREPHPGNRTSPSQEKASHRATYEGHHVDEIDHDAQEAVDTEVHVRKRPQQPQQLEPDVQL